MRNAIREVLEDLPEAVITAAVLALFEAVFIAWIIIAATPIPEVMQ
jgi:hypothetical protein